VRWSEETAEFAQEREQAGKLLGGVTSGPGSAESEYGGFGFYGIHAIELLLHTMQNRFRAVSAVRNGSNVVGSLTADSGETYTVQVLEGLRGFHAVAFGEKGMLAKTVGSSYEIGLQQFFAGLENNRWCSIMRTCSRPVAIIEAMEKSMQQNGETVELEKLNT
jgi:hypothetical protein